MLRKKLKLRQGEYKWITSGQKKKEYSKEAENNDAIKVIESPSDDYPRIALTVVRITVKAYFGVWIKINCPNAFFAPLFVKKKEVQE